MCMASYQESNFVCLTKPYVSAVARFQLYHPVRCVDSSSMKASLNRSGSRAVGTLLFNDHLCGVITLPRASAHGACSLRHCFHRFTQQAALLYFGYYDHYCSHRTTGGPSDLRNLIQWI